MLNSRVTNFRRNFRTATEAAELLWQRRELLLETTRRDVERYAGQALGAWWAVIAPHLTISTYMLAFGVIFRSRIGPDDNGSGYDNGSGCVAFALVGVVPWMGLPAPTDIYTEELPCAMHDRRQPEMPTHANTMPNA
jgi:ABC-type polysaccharide/polyol phosphate export permease